MGRARILVVDDEESPRTALRYILKDRYEVVLAEGGPQGLATFTKDGPFDVVLLDLRMPELDGMQLLRRILQQSPRTPCIMITALSDVRSAVEAMKLGAVDYLNKPVDVEELRLVIQRVLKERSLEQEVGRLQRELQSSYKFENIIGNSPAMQRVYALIQRLLDTDSTVLIGGETGTGKELVARALHYNSQRKAGPFIPVHCAAIPSELLESELFGHEKGAFTGALQRRIGMFEAANGGTLFLDEIGEMPLGTQAKLLRAIQEREIRRVGGQETIPVNVRLVCATHRNLEHEVKKGNFREDLFYRINVVPILLPPLRERREDIPLLVHHFVERFAKQFNRPVPTITPEAMNVFVNYPWPGNVRELEHAIERLMITCDASRITAADLPFVLSHTELQADAATVHLATEPPRVYPFGTLPETSGGLDLPKLTEELERQAIERALQQSRGVITEAARYLNITRRMLRYKIEKLGIVVKTPDGSESVEVGAGDDD